MNPGDQLGPYSIVELIGKGGMGEVYRAHDPRMGRDVAIKISAEEFNERFAREVHAVAALNHPNICHLYDVGPNYLVMELVEGITLADRIKSSPVPLEEGLAIAHQIAGALEAAHDKGIVHRDLKPANIKVKPDGTVKVLDVGLAQVRSAVTASGSAENSPTITLAATLAGMILGTRLYGARASAGHERRQARRYLGVRRGVLRDAHRQTAFSRGGSHRHDRRGGACEHKSMKRRAPSRRMGVGSSMPPTTPVSLKFTCRPSPALRHRQRAAGGSRMVVHTM